MKYPVFDKKGNQVHEANLNNAIFGLEVKQHVVHEAYVAQISNSREAIADTKDRSEVRGGGKKPWRQKGTGRARHGSSRSPIWSGGGVTFGPTSDRNFSKKINKQVRRQAILMMLSDKVKGNKLVVVDDLKLASAKTKEMNQMLSVLVKERKADGKKMPSVLVATEIINKDTARAARNLSYSNILAVVNLNVGDLLKNEYLVLGEGSLKTIENTFVKSEKGPKTIAKDTKKAEKKVVEKEKIEKKPIKSVKKVSK